MNHTQLKVTYLSHDVIFSKIKGNLLICRLSYLTQLKECSLYVAVVQLTYRKEVPKMSQQLFGSS